MHQMEGPLRRAFLFASANPGDTLDVQGALVVGLRQLGAPFLSIALARITATHASANPSDSDKLDAQKPPRWQAPTWGFSRAGGFVCLCRRQWPLFCHVAHPLASSGSNLEALFVQRAVISKFHGMISALSSGSGGRGAGCAVRVRRILPRLELRRDIAP